MKIVIINGSARKGNTLTAIQAFADGAASEEQEGRRPCCWSGADRKYSV